VKRLVLSHFVPADDPSITDTVCREAVGDLPGSDHGRLRRSGYPLGPVRLTGFQLRSRANSWLRKLMPRRAKARLR
jgi:hypothetical protein